MMHGKHKSVDLHLKWSELPSLTEGMITGLLTGQRPTSRSPSLLRLTALSAIR